LLQVFGDHWTIDGVGACHSGLLVREASAVFLKYEAVFHVLSVVVPPWAGRDCLAEVLSLAEAMLLVMKVIESRESDGACSIVSSVRLSEAKKILKKRPY